MTNLTSLPFFNLDDDEFQLAIFEYLNGGSIKFNADGLASLKFNPLLCESYKNFSLYKDLDPDSNFYPDIENCKYFTEASFNNTLTEQQRRLNLGLNYDSFTSSLSMLHLNIRSIKNKLGKFCNFLGSLNIKFPIIGISETWLDDSFHNSHISGNKFMHNFRAGRTGGGVGLYLTDYLNCKQRSDLVFSDNWAESLFVEIIREKEKNVIVRVICRPPDQKLKEFLDDIDLLLDNISKENKIKFLMGDWNLNLMNHSHHNI